jgi:hypothetical protein
VIALSKAWVCGRSLTKIVCSNPAGGMDVCLLWLLWGLCDGLVSRPEESYRVWSVKCVIVKPRKLKRPWPPRGCRAIGKKVSKSQLMSYLPAYLPTYLPTYLPPSIGIFLQIPIFRQWNKKFPVFYKIRKFIAVFIKDHHWSSSKLVLNFHLIYFYRSLVLPNSVFLWFLYQKSLPISILFQGQQMTFSSHPYRFYHIRNTWREVQTIKLFIMHFLTNLPLFAPTCVQIPS